jgi:cell division protein FtsI (penicillin-binding protein 3)
MTASEAALARAPAEKGRLTFLMIGCAALAAAVVGRAAFVQIVTDPRLEHLARRQFQSKVLIQPRRGLITDRTGEPLAVNIETSSLAANPEKIQNRRTLARILSKATGLPYEKLVSRLGEKREFIWIKRHLGDAELARLRKWNILGADGDLPPGLWLVKEARRAYPHGELASTVVGSVNVDSDGVEGVELWMNEHLRGKVASVSAIKDALGRPAFIDAVAAKGVQDGETVALSIDASLEFAVEEALKTAARKTGARGGTVVVMNAVTGELLALASDPSFNPDDKNVPADHRRSRAVTDGYEPGSVMKPVLLAGALSRGFKLTDTVYGERGHFTVQGHRINEAEAKERFGILSLKQIIQLSSNVGAAKLALKLGADRLYATLKAFGFGARTELGFPGEIPGRIPARKTWQPLELANIGFGQGVLVTPLQVARAYATFLNGGWLVRPTLFKDDHTSSPPRRVISPRVAEDVVEALESVTADGGTGLKARLAGYRVAGKTGTAQLVDAATHRYARGRHNATFVGFAVGVEPRIVILAELNEPRGVYFAAETAAPLFREVLTAVTNRFSLPAEGQAPPVLATATRARSVAGHAVRVGSKDSLVLTQAAPDLSVPLHWQGVTPAGATVWRMPELRGLTPREAIELLQGHRFRLELHGAGVVRGQAPEGGRALAEGDAVRLTLGEP